MRPFTNKTFYIVCLLLLFSTVVFGQFEDAKKSSLKKSVGGYGYLTFVTGGARSTDKLPLIIGLHFYGAKPADIVADFDRIDFPARVVLPQGKFKAEEGFSWFPADYVESAAPAQKKATLQTMESLLTFSKKIARKYPTTGKPFVTGFSYGGDLSFLLGVYHQRNFSAVFPFAARFLDEWLPESNRCVKQCAPVFVFQGDRDQIVSIENTRLSVEKLKKLGYQVKLHEYKDVKHDLSLQMKLDFTEKLREIIRQTD